MLTCQPKSICSWDYRVFGASAGPAELSLDLFHEAGGILLGPAFYTIRKHGLFGGNWTLEQNDAPVAKATKPSPLHRRFEIDLGELHLTTQATSPFARSYEILSSGLPVGAIVPVHPFTRRATIECTAEIPELAQLFTFWLAAITWRRAATA